MIIQHSARNDDWRTPHNIIDKAKLVLGDIDLDPASSTEANEYIHAKQIFTEETDGLKSAWPLSDAVWINPIETFNPFNYIKHTKDEDFIEEVRNMYTLEPETGVVRLTDKSYFSSRVGTSVGYIKDRRVGKFGNYMLVDMRNRGAVPLHKVVFALYYGETPPVIDHIDGDTLNNRPSNLRASTHILNTQNNKVYRAGGTVGVHKRVTTRGKEKFSVYTGSGKERIYHANSLTCENAAKALRERMFIGRYLLGEVLEHTDKLWTTLQHNLHKGNIGHALFSCFSLNQLSFSQRKGVPSIMKYPFCVPSEPSHSNMIIYVPGSIDRTYKFKEVFSSLGDIVR